jgi:hypothetical protein
MVPNNVTASGSRGEPMFSVYKKGLIMLRANYLKLALLSAVILSVSMALFFYAYSASQSISLSLLVSVFAACTFSLLAIVFKFWLFERFPIVKNTLERIPGVHFSTPVPDHIRSVYDAKSALPTAKHVPIGRPIGGNIPTEEPFTLGTLAFEPPEPIAGALSTDEPEPPVLPAASGAPVLNNVVGLASHKHSVEGAFRKAERPKPTTRKQMQINRFKSICRVLKQANQEVAVWTEGELATLANTMLDEQSEDKEMIALLLPQRVLRIKNNRTFEFEHHAQVFNNILSATDIELPVSFVNSSKEEMTGQCMVNFEFLGKPITWRFIEQTDLLSEKFLKNTLLWVGKHAEGRFMLLSGDDYQESYIYISDSITQALAAVMAETA